MPTIVPPKTAGSNKSRLPPYSSSELTNIIRVSTQVNANTSMIVPKKMTVSSLFGLAARNYAQSSALAREDTILRTNTTRINSSPPLEEPVVILDWFLVDDENNIYYADSSFSTVVSTNTILPVATNAWSFVSSSTTSTECVFTGSYWYVFDKYNKRLLRGNPQLKQWSVVSGVTTAVSINCTLVLGESGTLYLWTPTVLYISRDHGLTWTSKTHALSATPPGFVDVIYSNGRLIITGTVSNQYTIHVSDDEASTVTKTYTTSSGFFTIAKFGTNLYVFQRFGNVIASADNGSTWQVAFTTSGYTYYADLKYTGSYYVASGYYGSSDGPVWSTTGATWNNWSTTDGSTMNTYDMVKRNLHYNGSSFVFRSEVPNTLSVSADGKVWRILPHPVQGRKFVAGFPRVTDVNRNLL
jgi:hypothetical protein